MSGETEKQPNEVLDTSLKAQKSFFVWFPPIGTRQAEPSKPASVGNLSYVHGIQFKRGMGRAKKRGKKNFGDGLDEQCITSRTDQ